MAHRLDVLMHSRGITNDELARRLGYSPNYISGVRNGQTPGLKLGIALCREFQGELLLSDLGIEIDPALTSVGRDEA